MIITNPIKFAIDNQSKNVGLFAAAAIHITLPTHLICRTISAATCAFGNLIASPFSKDAPERAWSYTQDTAAHLKFTLYALFAPFTTAGLISKRDHAKELITERKKIVDQAEALASNREDLESALVIIRGTKVATTEDLRKLKSLLKQLQEMVSSLEKAPNVPVNESILVPAGPSTPTADPEPTRATTPPPSQADESDSTPTPAPTADLISKRDHANELVTERNRIVDQAEALASNKPDLESTLVIIRGTKVSTPEDLKKLKSLLAQLKETISSLEKAPVVPVDQSILVPSEPPTPPVAEPEPASTAPTSQPIHEPSPPPARRAAASAPNTPVTRVSKLRESDDVRGSPIREPGGQPLVIQSDSDEE